MKQEITMGSLFSGSGGFELAGSIFGIRPIWASEIEPFPIRVTTKNFPEMQHLGDINKLNGADLEPVTIIAGGSPCQDMSIAGKREGLDGSRSNLFREQIRIVKEMRESDRAAGRTGKQIRPRYMVWENVLGAFSSNKGKDFQAVLQEIVSITDEESNVPLSPKGKWQTAGCIMGDNFSIAWRVFDAQYWGVPQRRKRIYLVADFGGNTAPKILFERESLSRNFEESREAWQRTAGDIKNGSHKTSTEDVECYDISDRRRVADKSEVSPTLTTKMGTGGNNVPIVIETHGQDARWRLSEDNIVQTLASNMGMGGQCATYLRQITMQIRSGCEGGGKGALMQIDKSATLSTHNTQTLFEPIPIADKATRYKGGGDTRNNDGSANGLGIGEPGAPANTLTAADRHGVACFAQQVIGIYEESDKASCLKRRDYKDSTDLIVWEYIIRRLTPLECCRLQGFPDNWAEELGIPEPKPEEICHWRQVFRTHMEAMGEDKKEKTDNQIRKWLKEPESDSAKYKMWGNGIALPCAMFVMEGIAIVLEEEINEE